MAEAICQTRFVDGECKILWECPYCKHTLSYRIEHNDAGKLAMVSHLVRCHRMSYWQVLGIDPEAKEAAEEYFRGDVW